MMPKRYLLAVFGCLFIFLLLTCTIPVQYNRLVTLILDILKWPIWREKKAETAFTWHIFEMFYPSFWLETVLTGPRVLKSYLITVVKRNCRVFLQRQLFVCFLLNTCSREFSKIHNPSGFVCFLVKVSVVSWQIRTFFPKNLKL